MRSTALSIASALFALVAVPCCRSAEPAYDLLTRAQYFADLYNWRAATTLFQEAEKLFRERGDRRNAMYAHVGTLRLGSTAPLPYRSRELADLLADKLFGDDKELRLFALTVKGDLDTDLDQSAARQDWTDVQKL